jgi:hypothetical protein
MLRIYFLQQWFNMSDPQAEDSLYDSAAMRNFVGIDLGNEAAPDETTICKFRHPRRDRRSTGMGACPHTRCHNLNHQPSKQRTLPLKGYIQGSTSAAIAQRRHGGRRIGGASILNDVLHDQPARAADKHNTGSEISRWRDLIVARKLRAA